MRVKEAIDYIVVKAGAARKGEIPNDLHAHILDALNLCYEQQWNLAPWDATRVFALELTTTDGDITIPSYVDNVQAARIANRPLLAVGVVRVNNFDPDSFETEGTPCNFMWLAPSPVLTQPSGSINVRIISSSTADTSAVGSIRVMGLAGGVDTVEELTLNGTTNVTGTVSFTEIRKISKPITTGRITVKDSSNTEYGTIAPWETTPEYKKIRLVPPPTESTTVTLQCLRKFERLVSDNDPIIPSILCKALIHQTTAEVLRKYENYELAAAEDALAVDAMKTVESNENQQNEKGFSTLPVVGMFGDIGDNAGERGWPYYRTS